MPPYRPSKFKNEENYFFKMWNLRKLYLRNKKVKNPPRNRLGGKQKSYNLFHR